MAKIAFKQLFPAYNGNDCSLSLFLSDPSDGRLALTLFIIIKTLFTHGVQFIIIDMYVLFPGAVYPKLSTNY